MYAASLTSALEFICNICGSPNRRAVQELTREDPSCSACGSNVRTRGILRVLSNELFGVDLTLPEFPRVKSLRGIGTSDKEAYAVRLAEKFDYRNTFFHREPRLDLANLPEEESGRYDFLISSEVLEHVPPPVETALQNASRLLKPSGVFVLTVPYSIEPAGVERFPQLHQYGLVEVGGRILLVNRTPEDALQIFEDLVFHGGRGSTLEMREFNEDGLKALLTSAGFCDVRMCAEDYRPFGIVHAESWSLPIAARKGPFALGRGAVRDILEEWRDLRRKSTSEMEQIESSVWHRIGRKLGFVR